MLVNSIPETWLSEEALANLFDVFPGGVRNIWLNRDLTTLLDKINLRTKVHAKLESAETDLIKAAKKAQLKRINADEKELRKMQKLKAVTEEEKAVRDAQEEDEANRLANSGDGVNAGSQDDIPYPAAGSVHESEIELVRLDGPELETVEEGRQSCDVGTSMLKKPLSKVGKGPKGAATKGDGEASDTRRQRHGFVDINLANGGDATSRVAAGPGRAFSHSDKDRESPLPASLLDEARTHSRAASTVSENSMAQHRKNTHSIGNGAAPRQTGDVDSMYVRERTRFWQFWKPPSGAYTSPVPRGADARELRQDQAKSKTTSWHKVSKSLPFLGDKGEGAPEYPRAFNPDHQSDEDGGA